MLGRSWPACARASKAIPPVMAPSPMTATTFRSMPCFSAASAMPIAAEMLVEECPTPKVSKGLSLRLGKPDNPSSWRMLFI